MPDKFAGSASLLSLVFPLQKFAVVFFSTLPPGTAVYFMTSLSIKYFHCSLTYSVGRGVTDNPGNDG